MTERRWAVAAGVVLALLAGAAINLRHSFTPLLVAFGLAYAFNPVANALERRGWSRGAAALLLIAGIAGGLSLAGWIVVPRAVRETAEFAQDFPRYVRTGLSKLGALGARFGLELPRSEREVYSEIGKRLEEMPSTIVGALLPAAGAARTVLSGALTAATALITIFLVPVLFYYLVRSLPELREEAVRLVPVRHQPLAERELSAVDRVFSGYIRGQLLVGAILAGVFAVGLPLLGVRFGLFIGIATGLLNVVPYVGQLVGCLIALAVVLTDFGDWWHPVAVCVLFGATNYLEGTFLSPKIVGDRVGLSPAEAIMALVVGGESAGLVGMLLALPVAGSAKALLVDLLNAYRRSELYQRP